MLNFFILSKKIISSTNCFKAAREARYTWRHNAILRILVDHVENGLQAGDSLYADLPGRRSPSEMFHNILPDITVTSGGNVYILELTCCYEKKLVSSKEYKHEKYKHPSDSCKVGKMKFHVFTLEISSLGFASCSELSQFLRLIKVPPVSTTHVRRMGEMALRSSFFIFCCRHKPWPANLSDPYFLTSIIVEQAPPPVTSAQ